MSTRTQVTIDTELLDKARARAAEQGISLTEHIRRLVASDLVADRPSAQPEQPPARGRPDVAKVFDLGASSEPTDIARDKDRLVAEALWDEHRLDAGRSPRPGRRTTARKP